MKQEKKEITLNHKDNVVASVVTDLLNAIEEKRNIKITEESERCNLPQGIENRDHIILMRIKM